MAQFPDLSGNGRGSRLAEYADFDNLTTKTLGIPSTSQRVRIVNIALTLDAAGTITITDGTTPRKFELSAAGAIVLDRKMPTGSWYYIGAPGVVLTVSASSGNMTGFIEWEQH